MTDQPEGPKVPAALHGAIYGGKIAATPAHNHNSAGRIPGCPLCDVLNELERERPPIIGSESTYPTPDGDDLPEYPDSLDPNEWADAFAKADPDGGMDMDGLAAWFAAALKTGQQDPTGEIAEY